jgi:hypothetical protein
VWFKILREGGSNTAWARERGITSEQLRQSFAEHRAPRWMLALSMLTLMAALLVLELFVYPNFHWSTPVSEWVRFAVTALVMLFYPLFFWKRPERATGAARGERPNDARFSRTAILGACWPFFVFAILVLLVSPLTGLETDVAIPLAIVLSVIGTANLGWIAISQIRNSAGRLHGMWLAVLDGLLPPLLTLDGLVLYALHQRIVIPSLAEKLAAWAGPGTDATLYVAINNALVLLTLGIMIGANVLIVRKVWRAVTEPAEPVEPDSSEKNPDIFRQPFEQVWGPKKPDHFWRWFALAVMAMITLPFLIHIAVVLFVYGETHLQPPPRETINSDAARPKSSPTPAATPAPPAETFTTAELWLIEAPADFKPTPQNMELRDLSKMSNIHLLTAPRVTTKTGYAASIEMPFFSTGTTPGIRFDVLPQITGDSVSFTLKVSKTGAKTPDTVLSPYIDFGSTVKFGALSIFDLGMNEAGQRRIGAIRFTPGER